MLQRPDLRDIKDILGSAVYRRAINYYENNYVHNVKQTEEGFTARVSGNSYAPYYTEVFLDGNTIEAYCNCPYIYGICKHAGALLLKIYYENLLSDEIPLEDYSELERSTTATSSQVSLEKQRVGNYHLKNFEALTSFENTKKRYKLVFCIARQSRYVVLPKLLYIKKNGDLGRSRDYSKSLQHDPPSGHESVIIDIAGLHPEAGVPVDSVLHLLMPRYELQFYNEGTRNFYRQGFFTRMHISFMPASRNHSGSFNFTPWFHFLNDDGKTIVRTTTAKAIAFSSKDIMFIDDESDVLLFMENTPAVCQFLEYLKHSNIEKNASYDDIDELVALVTEIDDPHLTAAVDFNSIELKQEVPKTIINVTPKDEELSMNVLFKYQENEIDSRSGAIAAGVSLEQDKDEIVVFVRNEEFEERAVKIVTANLPVVRFNPYFGGYEGYYSSGLFSLSCSLETFIAEFTPTLMDSGFYIRIENTDVKTGGSISIQAVSNIDWLEVNLLIETGQADKQLQDFDFSCLDNGYLKAGNELVMLSPQDISLLRKLQVEGISKNGKLKTSKLNFPLIDELSGKTENTDFDFFKRAESVMTALRDMNSIKKLAPGPNFKGTLRHYQEAGLNWLYFLYEHELNGCLADDMGLGKTIQTIALLTVLKDAGKLSGKVLLVVPVVTMANWEREIKAFSRNLDCKRHAGQHREFGDGLFDDIDILILSYHTLRNDIAFFKDIQFSYLIMDEAHYVKNTTSQIYKAIESIQAEHKISLTGTPMENNIFELWAQMNILNAGLLGPKSTFKKRYKAVQDSGGRAEESRILRAKVSPFIMRRTKQEVLDDLPDKEEIVYTVELNSDQKKLYDEKKEYYQNRILGLKATGEGQRIIFEIMRSMLGLRQIALFPELNDPEYSGISSAKFDAFKELIQEITAEDHKVLVFSQFEKCLMKLKTWLDSINLSYSYISGKVKKRDKQIEQFQNDPEIKLFLITLKAGGVGINLTAADYVILFDPWWNPAAEQQAVDRAHRIGQKNKVTIYKLIAQDSIEEKILELQNKKKNLVDNLITEDAGVVKSLSDEDLSYLFS